MKQDGSFNAMKLQPAKPFGGAVGHSYAKLFSSKNLDGCRTATFSPPPAARLSGGSCLTSTKLGSN